MAQRELALILLEQPNMFGPAKFDTIFCAAVPSKQFVEGATVSGPFRAEKSKWERMHSWSTNRQSPTNVRLLLGNPSVETHAFEAKAWLKEYSVDEADDPRFFSGHFSLELIALTESAI